MQWYITAWSVSFFESDFRAKIHQIFEGFFLENLRYISQSHSEIS